MSAELNKFRFSHTMQVRYSDMDMLGHANNAIYLTYLELARLEYFEQVSRRQRQDIALVLAHASMDFRVPITPGVEPVVQIRTSKLGTTSITMENLITDASGERIYYTATTVLVAISTATGRPVPIAEEEKQKIIDYEPALA